MSLEKIINNSFKKEKLQEEIEITPELLRQYLPQLRETISYWRLYPDKFIDYMASLNPDNTFSLYFYQRVFLRALFRHKYVYATFVRA